LTAGQGQVVLTATTGKTIRFSEEAVNPQISGSGVAAMNLGAEGRVIGGGVVESEATFLVIGAEGGYYRRTPLADLPLHNRGGQGVYTWKGWKGVGPPLYSVVAGAEEVITLPGGARVKVSDIYLGGPGLKPAQIGS
ncbi:MAG: hypothetical protein GY796_14830, partial [Chloroflexi bacterium]|nr:hypothetical protein [Chloroflexota bacterium]